VIRVHNISHLPHYSGRAVAVTLGGTTVRPGKSAIVPIKVLNAKHYDLHERELFFGDLPVKYRRKTRSPQLPPVSGTLGLEDARAHLRSCSTAQLLKMCASITPPLRVKHPDNRDLLVSRLGRCLFSKSRILDPQIFLWLNRWDILGGDYVLKEE